MDFTNFTELIRTEVAKKVGYGYSVKLEDVRKNNGIILRGLYIMQENNNIAPAIYLNGYYEKYRAGTETISCIVSNILDTYNQNKIDNCVNMHYFLNFEDVKSRIVFTLINTERNRELLEEIPHIEFLDLSIVFQCLVLEEVFGLSLILIRNSHLRLWDVTKEELYQAAKENTPKLMPFKIKSMQQVLFEIMKEENPEAYSSDECPEQYIDHIPLFVLSNRRNLEGASCILYPNVLHDFADTINNNFYIIPSSVHEVLLMPAETTEESNEIVNMIQEINDTQVSVGEVLSYSLYYYDRQTGKIVKL